MEVPDPDLVEFACMAHDIGHPPFGHVGETELNNVVNEHIHKIYQHSVNSSNDKPDNGKQEVWDSSAIANLGGFEGNPQSFRIVTRLAHKWIKGDGDTQQVFDDRSSRKLPTQWFGLDITAASMDAVSKYPWYRTDEKQSKWGVYGEPNDDSSDRAMLYWARDKLQAKLADNITQDFESYKKARSFECQLMDWCDDVTYAVHDVEDFFQIGLIPLHLIFGTPVPPPPIGILRNINPDVAEGPLSHEIYQEFVKKGRESVEWVSFREYVKKKWTDKGRTDIDDDYLDHIRSTLLKAGDGLSIGKAPEDSAFDRRMSHYRANQLIQHFIRGVSFEGTPMLHNGMLKLSDSIEEEKILRDQCSLLKELVWRYVIESPSLATHQAGQRKIVRNLFLVHRTEINLLPRQYQDLIEGNGSGYKGKYAEEYAKIRVAADYVSSLTEPHAISLHNRLMGSELGGFRTLT